MDSKLGRRNEILGILCFAAGLLSVLSLYTYDSRGGENWIGQIGESAARALVVAFGGGAWGVPFALFLSTLYLLRQRPAVSLVMHLFAMFVFVVLSCPVLHLVWPGTLFGEHLPGGALGEMTGELLRSLLGLAGALVVCLSALAITVILRYSFSFVGLLGNTADAVAAHGGGAGKLLSRWIEHWFDAWRAAQRLEQKKRGKKSSSTGKNRAPRKPKEKASLVEPLPLLAAEAAAEADPHAAILLDDEEEVDGGEEELVDEEGELEDEPAPVPSKRGKRNADQGPTIIAPRLDPSRRPAAHEVSAPPKPVDAGGPFHLPPTTLLAAAPDDVIEIDHATLRANAEVLTEKLEAYGVKGRVDAIQPGPVVTMYEFEPQSGTKISKIAGLSDDLAMALAAQKVRIVAPIPGKARVGFELPNEARQTVYLRELLEDRRWDQLDCALPLAFGKDIVGQPVYGDLSKMPHLLVAGATGAGKSVGLNVMLASLLMKKTPKDVRLLMIDPKVVELAVFDGIPHMLLPVVTDMKKASLALRWAVDEMERRYQLFADAGARNLTTYNARVEKVERGEMTVATFAPRRAGKVRAQGPNGEELLLTPTDGEAPDGEDWQPERLPSIVLVVDEFADLMMVAAKDVEAAIARLAQKARAAGIHVILATQRPSVDVITGMIKANFPSRIAYKVSQREDSKTILGRTGAEHLLGLGDMLSLMPGSNDLKRVHSAYISEDEVKALCDYLRLQGAPVYDDDILKPRDDEEDGELGLGMVSDDPLYDRAVAIVAQAGYCSISHIQRNLSVGYNKAAKLVERMEKEGVVGPASGKAGGRREVFIEAR
jgi:S-DNA-T family DNA segregation ATPase FtsK/SpoIIIE